MERVRLTEEEKQALRGIKDGTLQGETLMAWADVVASLQDKRLIEARWEGQELRRVRLTLFGAFYFRSNPRLRNPIDWQRVTAWAAIIGAATGIIGLFRGLCHIGKMIYLKHTFPILLNALSKITQWTE